MYCCSDLWEIKSQHVDYTNVSRIKIWKKLLILFISLLYWNIIIVFMINHNIPTNNRFTRIFISTITIYIILKIFVEFNNASCVIIYTRTTNISIFISKYSHIVYIWDGSGEHSKVIVIRLTICSKLYFLTYCQDVVFLTESLNYATTDSIFKLLFQLVFIFKSLFWHSWLFINFY